VETKGFIYFLECENKVDEHVSTFEACWKIVLDVDYGLMESTKSQYVEFVWNWYDLGFIVCFSHAKIY
jgi:hypothetical protein